MDTAAINCSSPPPSLVITTWSTALSGPRQWNYHQWEGYLHLPEIRFNQYQMGWCWYQICDGVYWCLHDNREDKGPSEAGSTLHLLLSLHVCDRAQLQKVWQLTRSCQKCFLHCQLLSDPWPRLSTTSLEELMNDHRPGHRHCPEDCGWPLWKTVAWWPQAAQNIILAATGTAKTVG